LKEDFKEFGEERFYSNLEKSFVKESSSTSVILKEKKTKDFFSLPF